jgi:ribose/xylose/arabinose/galactoside ABC-type transport system permease subunit
MEESVKQSAEAAIDFRMRGMRNPLRSQYAVFFLSAVYFLVCTPFVPGFASAENAGNIFANLLPLLIVAIGQTFVLIAGGIDLSVTATIAMSSVTGALVMSGDGGWLAGSRWAMPAGLVAMLLAGALIGLLNGAAITQFKMPAFIVTLTTMMFFGGLAVSLTKSKTIYNLPHSFNALGKGVLPSVLVTTLLAVAAQFALGRTLFGRWLYAVGHNARTAQVSGVQVNQTIMLAYVACGVCAAVAGVLYTGRMETGSPVMGQRILLDVIGAAVIGGTSLFGGKGKVLWTVGGVLFITLIDNSLNLLGLSHFTIMMVKGGVILSAALLDRLRNRAG